MKTMLLSLFRRPSGRVPARRFIRPGLAMTLVEMIISIGIFSLVGSAMSYLTLAAARSTRDGAVYIRSEVVARETLDLIRKQVLIGEYKSLQISSDRKTVRFLDPIRDRTSGFIFQNHAIGFYPVMDQPPARIIKGINNVQFSLQSNNSILVFDVMVQASNCAGDLRPIQLQGQVLLRNLPYGA